MPTFGLIGFPLVQSASQRYFNHKFISKGLADHSFELFPIKDISAFPALINQMQELKGLAVTMPYKESVIEYLDELDEDAKKIGSVNCISLHNGKTKGFNTDVIGFEKSLEALQIEKHRKAMILGTGGASKAVQFVLKKKEIPFLLISRSKNEGMNQMCYEEIGKEEMESHTLIVNCTPKGMFPQINDCPSIPYQHLSKFHLCYDLIYKPETTRFLQLSSEKGATIKNGMEMLELQAEENWRIWNL